MLPYNKVEISLYTKDQQFTKILPYVAIYTIYLLCWKISNVFVQALETG